MLKNILTTTLRALYRQRFFSAVNIFGLALGFAGLILITLYLQFEYSYDKFYPGSSNIYRINTDWSEPGSDINIYATSPPPLAEIIKMEIPDVENVTRLYKWGDFTLRSDNDSSNVFRETNIYLADESYFQVFREQLLAGDEKTALSEPVSIVLTESTANKYFGMDTPYDQLIGRHLLGGKDGGTLWKITAIMKDLPVNSHQNFDGLVSSITLIDIHTSNIWSWNLMHTYVVIPNKSGIASTEDKLNQIAENHGIASMGLEEFYAENQNFKYVLQPVEDIHLHSNYLREIRANGNVLYTKMFLVAGLLILIIACVNYINLTTAQASSRAKEIGVRKVLGEGKWGLTLQFLGESALLAIISVVLALGIVEMFLINFSDILGLKFTYSIFKDHSLTLGILVSATVIGALMGAYPAYYLVSFKTSEVLKGKLNQGHDNKIYRDSLVAFQFFVSAGLIVCAGVVNSQLAYMHSRDVGFERENVLIIQNDREIDDRREEFKETLVSHSSITGASFSTGIPTLLTIQMRDVGLEQEVESKGFYWYQIDDKYPETLGMELMAGRWISRERASDSLAAIVNESAANELGYGLDIVGNRLIINRGANDEHRVEVVGVVKNFNTESFYSEVKPLVMESLVDFLYKDYISIRIAPGKTREAFDYIVDTWKVFEPNVPFNYSFLDDRFDAQFKSEQRLGQVFTIMSLLTVVIASMGLFGLAAFSISLKRKEIGIRKVLGASISSIVGHLSKGFTILAFFGVMAAVPVSYFTMDLWLSRFIFKTDISPWLFVATTAGLMVLSLLTVSFQTIKAAMSNPVDTLKDE